MHISQESLILYLLYLYCRMELMEPSGVDDTHYGIFRVPVRANKVPPVTQASAVSQKARVGSTGSSRHQVQLMIFTKVDSESQLGLIRYHQWLSVCSESESWNGTDRMFRVFQIQWKPVNCKQDENELKDTLKHNK